MEEQTVDAFGDAQKAATLRDQISSYAAGAVKYGHVDRVWANNWLARLGAPLITGNSEYRINVPITGLYGKTVTAGSRTAAMEKFKEHVDRVTAAGQITDGRCDSVYSLDVTGSAVFFSGPEDPTDTADVAPLSLGELKDAIREMLKVGISTQGWGYTYAQDQLAAMGLELLPNPVRRTVMVPVAGTAPLDVWVFEGDDEDAALRAATTLMVNFKSVEIKPDEVGVAYVPRSEGTMGLTLVDDEGDDDEPY